MSQAKFIRKTYIKNVENNGAWQYTDGSEHEISIRLNDFEVEPDKMDFESDDFPYFRIALLDKYLEETDAEK